MSEMSETCRRRSDLKYGLWQPPLINIDGELEFEITEVVDSKIDKQQQCKLLYYVRWLGYKDTDEEFSWLPAMELEHATELVADFHSTYPTKPGPLAYV